MATANRAKRRFVSQFQGDSTMTQLTAQVTTPATATAPAGSATMQGDLWSVRASDYAEVQEPTFLPLYESVASRPELANAKTLLDVGCGPGLAAQTLAKRIGRIAGIDAAAAFIAIAQRRVPHGDFRVCEMETLPHADGTFDVVTGFNGFQYAARPVNALREARRVSKPGGHIVIAVWGLPKECEAAGHLKALGGLMPPPPPGAPGPFALSDESKLRAFATEAGLVPLAVVDVACPWIYPSLETAVRGMLSAGPAERAIRASSIEQARDTTAGSIAPYRTPSGSYHLDNVFRYLIARA
jgi:SAM-dependent methyltransferase